MNNKLPFWPEWSVEEKLGQGSFGSVYRIRKQSAGSGSAEILSAMKVLRIPADPSEIRNLRNQGMGEPSIRKLLQNDVRAIENEIRVMISLASAAGVVTIEDYYIQELQDRIGWNVFIRMELLESLPAYLDLVGTLTEEEVLKMGCDLCDALAACESVDIIHRDIKPANIFRNRFGQFKLGDFGIAKKMEGTYHAATRIGTPSYEAPEVFKGLEYDHTVDIYGLGMVLYTFLNKGRKPFYPPYPEELTRENMQEALQKRLNGQPVPLIPGMDQELYDIIEKACAFEPSRRYQSAAEFKKDLERYRSRSSETKEKTDQKNRADDIHFDDEQTTQLESKKKNSRVPFIAAGVIAALMLFMGIFIGGRLSGKNSRESEEKIAELSAMLTSKPMEVPEPTGTVLLESTCTPTPEPTSTPTPEPTSTPTPEPTSMPTPEPTSTPTPEPTSTPTPEPTSTPTPEPTSTPTPEPTNTPTPEPTLGAESSSDHFGEESFDLLEYLDSQPVTLGKDALEYSIDDQGNLLIYPMLCCKEDAGKTATGCWIYAFGLTNQNQVVHMENEGWWSNLDLQPGETETVEEPGIMLGAEKVTQVWLMLCHVNYDDGSEFEIDDTKDIFQVGNLDLTPAQVAYGIDH